MQEEQKANLNFSVANGCTVAIAGLGLLGASLASRLQRLAAKPLVIGYARRAQTVEDAISRGIVDRGSTDPAEILPHADITVLCMPVTAIIDFVRQHSSLWRSGAVVTDVGSIKARIVEQAGPCLRTRGVCFVGSHPMAGSERTGLEHADENLYQGATVFLTPVADTATSALQAVEQLWKLAGANTHLIAADKHDALVARTSHLLHLLAAVAVQVGLEKDSAVLATAGGFRDFTRIASSSPSMWRQILELNCDEILNAETEFRQQTDMLRQLMKEGRWPEVEQYLAEAGRKRDNWLCEWNGLREAGE
jgi:prephenate dehydrogenase